MSIQILLLDSLLAAENSSDQVQKQVSDAVKQLPDEDHLLAAVINNTSFSVVVPGTPIQKLPDDWIDTLIDQAHLMREFGVIPRSLAFSELGSELSTLCLACGDFFDHSLTWINLLDNFYGAAINDVYPLLAARYPALDAAYPAIEQKLLEAEQILHESSTREEAQPHSDSESSTIQKPLDWLLELQKELNKSPAANAVSHNSEELKKLHAKNAIQHNIKEDKPHNKDNKVISNAPAINRQAQPTTTTASSSESTSSRTPEVFPFHRFFAAHSESASQQPKTSTSESTSSRTQEAPTVHPSATHSETASQQPKTSTSESTSSATSKPPAFPPSSAHSESASQQPETSSNSLHQPKYSFIPIIMSLLSLLILGCAMVINNLPELGIKTWPGFMDVPIIVVGDNNLPETVALMAVLIPCIAGLPRTVSTRIALIIGADFIYLIVSVYPIAWIYAALSIFNFGIFLYWQYDMDYWKHGSSEYFLESKSSGKDFYRYASTTRIFVYAIIIWAITIYPVSIAFTRMCLPGAQRTVSTEKTQTLEGLGVKELILCAGISLIFALCTACIMAVHHQEGFWGSGAGTQLGLIIFPIIVTVFSWFLSTSIDTSSLWENLLWSITILGPIASISLSVNFEDFELAI